MMAAPFLLGTVLEIGSKILDRVIPDPVQKDEAKFKLMQMAEKGDLEELNLLAASDANQVKLLEIDARSEDKFQKYPRPAAMWICVMGFFYQFVAYPFLFWMSQNMDWKVPPQLDLELLVTMLGGMLGLGVYRTIDKRSKFKYGGK